MRKVIVDTDCGIDDAQALLMVLSSPEIEVVAITTVHGNTTLDNVVKNVFRVLKVAGKETIPVFRGCESNLLCQPNEKCYDTPYHGHDGLGDFEWKDTVNLSLLKQEHASNALVNLTQQHEGDVELVALGPLTNIACALKLDPKLGENLKHCYIMGGNYKGRGNITMTAEFNFYSDPEAAQIVLQELQTEITLVGWEVCEENGLPWDQLTDIYGMENSRTAKQQFMLNAESNIIKSKMFPKMVYCDEVAMAVFLDASIIKTQTSRRCKVELSGKYARGMTVVDWMGSETLDKQPLVRIVTDIHMDKFKKLLIECLTS